MVGEGGAQRGEEKPHQWPGIKSFMGNNKCWEKQKATGKATITFDPLKIRFLEKGQQNWKQSFASSSLLPA